MNSPSILERLKERKLVQWALAYVAGAWVLLQVADTLGDNFGWPSVVFQSLSAFLAAGFLAALVLAWFHGEKGQQRVSGVELLLLAAVLAIAGGAVWLVGGRETTLVSSEQSQLGATPDGVTIASNLSLERSVAVLPFDNLSRDPDNEYFSDGITDEILTTLANVGDLRVISRTSVMQYKDTTKPLRQIAAELGVAHVLEGSVQRAGSQVRITAQLIDAKTDAHLWAQRYDRPLQDIFAVQSEIAEQIAQALQAKLSPAEQKRMERTPTTNLVAYNYVLRARNLLQNPDPRSTEPALTLVREAIALDPSYADAFATQAEALQSRYWSRGEAIWLDSAAIAARRAIALDSSFAPGYAALGGALNLRGDRAAALGALRQAVKLNPNLTSGLANLYNYDLGRLDEAARLWGRTLQSDPTNAISLWLAGRTYLHLGMTERARGLFARAKKVQPEFYWLSHFNSVTFLVEGRPQEARAEVERMLVTEREDPDDLLWAGHIMAALGNLPAARRYFERGLPGATATWDKELSGLALAWIVQQSGETERARRLLQEASERFEKRRRGQPRRPEDYVESAQIHVVAGDREGAIQELQRAVSNGWRTFNESPNDPILNSLRGDPRYDRLMAQVKADIDRQRARVEREGW